MARRASTQLQIDYAVSLYRKGLNRKIIVKEFEKRWGKKAGGTMDRILMQAQQELRAQNDQIKIKAIQDSEVVVEVLKNDIIDFYKRQQILSDIAQGKILITKPMNTRLGIVSVECLPNHTDRMQAIAELNRMDGVYMEKKELTINQFMPISEIKVIHTKPDDN